MIEYIRKSKYDYDIAQIWARLTPRLVPSIQLGSFVNRAYRNSGQSDCNTAATMFVAKINAGGVGGLTATNVPYDTDVNEGTIVPFAETLDGKIVLHNLTRGTSRKIAAVDTMNNNITTVASADAWADNDDITAESQTVTAGTIRFMDLDISAYVPVNTTGVYVGWQMVDSGAAALAYLHSYSAYAASKVFNWPSHVAAVWNYGSYLIPCWSQTICIAWNASGAGTLSLAVVIRGSIQSIYV